MGVPDTEPGSCDVMVKGVNGGEDEFQSMIDIFDFPLESVEGDDDLAAGWDATKLQSLGPIPTEAMGNGGAFMDAIRKYNSLGVGNAKPKQLPNYGKQSSKVSIHHENTPSYPQESGTFQSPISVLETGGAGKSLVMKPDIIIPVRSRSKRARASVFNPWFAMTPVTCATPAYKKAAGYKKPRGGKEKVSEASISSTSASGITDESFKEGKEDIYVAGHYETSIPMKKCSHCQVTKTPQWRTGPMGPKTLCNACGVRYRSGRLYPQYRPLASPTFVPTLHSNSHRKVVEMIKKNIVLEDGTVQEAPMTPPMEFIPQHSNSSRKVLGTRKKATVQEKDLMYDVSKPRKVMGTKKDGLGLKNDFVQEKVIMPKNDFVQEKVIMPENDNMQEKVIMPENDTMHNTFILSEAGPALDPNESTKFMGMRKKAIKQETDSTPDTPDTPMSPAPEFVPMSSYLFDFIY